MRRRTWISLAVVVAVLVALAVAIFLRKKAPPEVARLLPEADAIVYFNLQPLRELTRFDRHPVAHDPAYQAFIDATGIEFERDLDQAAFAVQRLSDPNGPNGPLAYSEVFEGRFDGPRLTKYLAAQAASTDPYAGHQIYSIPHDGRTVRLAILGYDLVAVSNTPTPEQIHSIIDRYHSAASPFSGNTLLSKYYSNVPLLSEAWGIGAIGLPFASNQQDQQFRVFGLPLPLPADSTFIASVRYVGAIHFRLEEIAPSANAAKETVAMANLALGMLRSVQVTAGPQDASVKDWNALLHSTAIKQKENRAVLSAVVPISLVRSLLSENKSAIPANNPPQSTP